MNKIILFSFVLIALSCLILTGCKASEKLAADTPLAVAAEVPSSSEEQEINAGLDELNELDTLEKDLDADLGLDELEKLDIE
ncbi:MAG: hypothetical protein AABW48_01700 [Nanoarchaeota archaeon]|mgnify:CR=1 FL=1